MKLFQALIAGLVAFGFAVADSTSTTTTTTTSVTKTAPTPKAKNREARKQILGSVVSVDAIANVFIVKTKRDDDTFSITDKTVVTPKGITVADLKADDKVAVSYKVEKGKWVAYKITLKPAKKLPIPKTPEAE